MSRSRIIILVLHFACISNSPAQRDAVIDEFLRPILNASSADPNVESWNWKANRNGGYILRRTMDVTGDRRPEIFLASTLHSSRWEHYWKIFDVADDGSLRPYQKGLSFSSAWPVTENGKTYLVQHPLPARPGDEWFRPGDGNLYRVIRHEFVFPDISETTNYVIEEEATKLKPTDPGNLPKLQVILLADYLTNPDAKWSDVTELEVDASDRYYLVEDKDRAEKNSDFTPQVALLALGLGQPTPKDQTGVRQSEQATSPSIHQQSEATKSKEATLTPNDESPGSTHWPVVAVVIVAALGLLWWLLKKRK